MRLSLRRVVDPERVAEILTILAGGTFVPGSVTAMGSAARVKHNAQLAPGSPEALRAGQVLLAALRANAVFEAATLPSLTTAPHFYRYEAGMRYGEHLDSPIMGESPKKRSDVSVTVSLVDAGDYEGGELVIDDDGASYRWKGDAGDCVIYPSDTLHRVEPVGRGARVVAVFWIQSLVRDARQRRILFDLAGVQELLDRTSPPGPHLDVLRRCQANLLRMWAEP